MYLSLESQLTKENLRLSYIVCPTAPHYKFYDTLYKLNFVIKNDGLMATSKCDSTLVYSILHSNITCDIVKTYIEQGSKKKCERLGCFSLEGLYEGKNNAETLIRDFLAQLNKQSYTDNGQGFVSAFTSWLFKYYSVLDNLKKHFTEADKLRHLWGIINVGSDMTVPFYINVWTAEADTAMVEHTEHGANGNVHKMNDDTGKFLPRVTKEWFTNHPNAKCPQIFKKTAKDVTSSSKYKNKQKKRERKIAATVAASADSGDDDDDNDDDEDLCSLSLN